jgi:DUF4097 and DUF4098 domain-containing protein YvlB
MGREVALKIIEKEISRLTPQEQLKIIEKLTRRLKRKSPAKKKELDWQKLYGLGKGLWKNEDAQKYVNRLREDRP